jgi:hypothetical protein
LFILYISNPDLSNRNSILPPSRLFLRNLSSIPDKNGLSQGYIQLLDRKSSNKTQD